MKGVSGKIATIMRVIALVMPSLCHADAASDFARFEAGVLAVEDRCENYYSLTDATMGNHLTAAEYRRAQEQVTEVRHKVTKALEAMSCQKAAEAVAEMGGLPYLKVLKVWERR